MKTSLKKGAFYLTISTLLFIVTGYIINIWLGRFLGPIDYGSYGVIVGLISLINLIQTSGFTQSAAKHIAEDESKADSIFISAFRIQIVATIIISVLFYFLAYPLAKLLNDLSLITYLQLTAFVFPVYGFYALLVDYYNGLHAFKKQALLNIVYTVTKALGILILAYLIYLKGAIIGFIIAPLVAIMIGFYYPSSVKSHFPYKKLLLFSLPLIGYIIFSTLLQSIDLYFVKALLGGEATGYYTASQNISKLAYFATIAIPTVLLPSISNSVSQNFHDKTKLLITNSLRTSLMIIVPAVLIISATSKELLILIYSYAYIPANESLSILVIAIGFFTIYTLLSTIITGAGSPAKSAILAVIGVIITSLLCTTLIPLLGLNGAALATTIATGSMMILAAMIVYKKFGVLIPQKSAFKILGASFLVFVLAKLITLPFIFLPFLYLFLFAVYIVVLYILGEITKENILFVKSLLPKRFWIK